MRNFALAISVALGLLLATSCNKTTSSKEQSNEASTEATAESLVVRLCDNTTSEVYVDLGTVEARSTATESIRIENATDEPIVLVDYETTCRCTTMEFSRKPIQPGESCVATLIFDSRGEWGTVGNYISIATSTEGCNIAVWMCAEID